MLKVKRENDLIHDDYNFVWVRADGREQIATENYVPGNKVYGERLVLKNKIEYRVWDPFRSKLAACIMNKLELFPFKRGSSVLYLGASTGTTVSHISDIVGSQGIIFGVEHTSRVAREFLDRVVSYRKNIIPIIHDARQPKTYEGIYGTVDIIYSDIAQPDQTNIAIANCERYLKKDGIFFMVIKTRSINVIKNPRQVVDEEIKKLKKKFEIIQIINLEPFDKDHFMVVAMFNR